MCTIVTLSTVTKSAGTKGSDNRAETFRNVTDESSLGVGKYSVTLLVPHQHD